ncbi:MAG TPA: rhodanese-like domain-containing protein [Pyrinomonadaceae bacterium]|nr:rhodanese-like domain-containing protein [Pyrinomonadaceae bacterium]
MNLKSLSLLVLLIAAVFLIACNSTESRKRPLVAASQPQGQVDTTYADGIPRITIHELEDLIGKGDVFVVDVRNQAAYDQGHIPGAKLIPVGEVANRIDEFPRDKQIVTYCS